MRKKRATEGTRSLACKDWARRDPSPLPRRSGAEPELLEEGPADLIRHDDELIKHALPAAAAAAAAEAPAAHLNAPHPVPQTQNFPLLSESLRFRLAATRHRPRLGGHPEQTRFAASGLRPPPARHNVAAGSVPGIGPREVCSASTMGEKGKSTGAAFIPRSQFRGHRTRAATPPLLNRETKLPASRTGKENLSGDWWGWLRPVEWEGPVRRRCGRLPRLGGKRELCGGDRC